MQKKLDFCISVYYDLDQREVVKVAFGLDRIIKISISMRLEQGNYRDLKHFADQQSEGNVSQLVRQIIDNWLREERTREIRRGKYQREKKFTKLEKAKIEKAKKAKLN